MPTTTPLRRPEIALVLLLLAAACGKKEEPRAADPPVPAAEADKPAAADKSAAEAAKPADVATAPADVAAAREGKAPPCGDFASCRDACRERKRGSCLRMHRRAGREQAAEVDALARQLCDQGHPEACHVRFLRLKSDREATKILTRGCDLAYGPSCAALADKTRDKTKQAELRARGTHLLDRHCQAEDLVACAVQAELARKPTDGQPPDLAKARWYGDRACDLGDEGACYALALQLGDKYPELVTALLDRACELNEPSACADFGDRQASAPGEARNMKRAAEAWQAACDSGVESAHRACARLATALIDGSLPRDPARAAALRDRGAELARRFEAK